MTGHTPNPSVGDGAGGAPVDRDLLADYLGGALDGTAEHDRVAALVADDPVWARARRELAEADRLVGAALADLGTAPPPMPDDVRDRIHDALRAATGLPETDAAAGAPAGASVSPISAARRRRRRIAGRLSAAAAAVVVLALAGVVGLGQLWGPPSRQTDTAARRPGTTATEQPGENHADAGSPTGRLGPDVQGPSDSRGNSAGPGLAPTGGASGGQPTTARVASGTDYTAATLPRAGTLTGTAVLDRAARARVPDRLARLVAPDALRRCLSAVSASRTGGARLVDYARYQGSPALVIVYGRGSTGPVVAVGPSCGEHGADIRHQTGR